MRLLLGSLLAWGLLFVTSNQVERWFAPERLEYERVANLSLTLLHAAFAMSFGSVAFLTKYNVGGPNTALQTQVMTVSFAFFAVDTVAMVLLRSARKDFFFHHVLCLGIEGYGIVGGHSGWEICVGIAVGEMAPCYYLKHLARLLEVDSVRFYRWNDVAYAFGFLGSRVLLLGWGLGLVLWSSRPTVAMKLAAVAFYGLGLYWSVVLVTNVRRHRTSTA